MQSAQKIVSTDVAIISYHSFIIITVVVTGKHHQAASPGACFLPPCAVISQTHGTGPAYSLGDL